MGKGALAPCPPSFLDCDRSGGHASLCPPYETVYFAASAAITGGAAWGGARCEELKTRHVGVLVKGWTWIPDALDGVYSCRCGVSCVWSKSAAAVDRPDALLYEGATPPPQVPDFLPLFSCPVTMRVSVSVYDELIGRALETSEIKLVMNPVPYS